MADTVQKLVRQKLDGGAVVSANSVGKAGTVENDDEDAEE
jgi:hypothetical protein